MNPARLQYGPYDGQTGKVPSPLPMALDVMRCHGCGCGRPIHYRVVDVEDPPNRGYCRYELVEIDDDGTIYRHADTLDPITERFVVEELSA